MLLLNCSLAGQAFYPVTSVILWLKIENFILRLQFVFDPQRRNSLSFSIVLLPPRWTNRWMMTEKKRNLSQNLIVVSNRENRNFKSSIIGRIPSSPITPWAEMVLWTISTSLFPSTHVTLLKPFLPHGALFPST